MIPPHSHEGERELRRNYADLLRRQRDEARAEVERLRAELARRDAAEKGDA